MMPMPFVSPYNKELVQTQIAQGTGTTIGDMTGGGGLSAAFDGNTDQAGGAANKNASSGYAGKDWGSGVTRTLTGAKVWGRNDAGYTDGGASVTIAVYGSNSAPSGPTDGTSIATVAASLADVNNSNPQEKLSGFDESTAYRYHWATITGGSGFVYFSEVQFFEDV